ncbi:MAG TPA: IS200/IS605 family transposase [Nitrospirota bacterium]|nr:IS200/IS605 family transposase [Nitrospirota bacterium]
MELTHSYHSVFSLNYHLVLVVAYRRAVLTERVLARCLEIAGDIAVDFNAAVVEANGEKDHIHILLSAPPDFNLCRMINSLKTVTSRRLKKEFPDIRKKLWKEKFWTSSYFVATSGGVPLEVIKQYIEEQGV